MSPLAFGISVRVSRLDGPAGRTLIVLTPLTVSAVLAVVLDLSDSAAATTAALAARFPPLLRGWDRTMPVWTYTLGGTSPLADLYGTVGNVIDGALDFRSVVADPRLLAATRVRGSFAGPTLAAIVQRQAAEDIGHAHVVLLGDGRLTDFAAVDGITTDLLGLIERQADTVAVTARWSEVIGGRPLVGFDDAACPAWFASRQPHAVAAVAVRVSGATGVSVLSSDGVSRPCPADGLAVTREPLRLMVSNEDIGELTVELRHADGTQAYRGGDLFAAGEPAEAADVALAQITMTASLRSVAAIDSAARPADAAALWHAAAAAYEAAGMNRSWAETPAAAPLRTAGRTAALLCLTNRPPIGPWTAGDRVVVVAVPDTTAGLAWYPGDALPIGTASSAFALTYDAYEDRWRITPPGFDLHPTGSDRVPAIVTDEGGCWVASFSGPLR